MPTVNLDPYLEYARNILRERTQTMSASLAGCVSDLLSRHGSKEDVELLERILEERPFVAGSVSNGLKELKRRLDSPKQISRPMLKDRPPTSEAATDNSADSARRPSTAKGVEETPSKPWITWISFTIVAGVVLWRSVWKTLMKTPAPTGRRVATGSLWGCGLPWVGQTWNRYLERKKVPLSANKACSVFC